MHDALYFPIHRAKKGEITSVGHLKPSTLPDEIEDSRNDIRLQLRPRGVSEEQRGNVREEFSRHQQIERSSGGAGSRS
jgi:hypothetical protein